MSINSRYINQIVKIVEIDNPAVTHTGKLLGVIVDRDAPSVDLWTRLDIEGLDGEFYLSDYHIIPVEIDGRRLPDVPGVYEFIRADSDMNVTAQLSKDGDWFPFPYLFSGWRAGELFMFDSWEPRPELVSDIPAILNPEDESLVARLISEFSTLSNVDEEEAAALAHKLVLEDRLFG